MSGGRVGARAGGEALAAPAFLVAARPRETGSERSRRAFVKRKAFAAESLRIRELGFR